MNLSEEREGSEGPVYKTYAGWTPAHTSDWLFLTLPDFLI